MIDDPTGSIVPGEAELRPLLRPGHCRPGDDGGSVGEVRLLNGTRPTERPTFVKRMEGGSLGGFVHAMAANHAPAPSHSDARIEHLEARVAELERLVAALPVGRAAPEPPTGPLPS